MKFKENQPVWILNKETCNITEGIIAAVFDGAFVVKSTAPCYTYFDKDGRMECSVPITPDSVVYASEAEAEDGYWQAVSDKLKTAQ